MTTSLELARKSASSRQASQSTNFTWTSIVLKCGRIYPELFAASNPNRDSNWVSTSIGQNQKPFYYILAVTKELTTALELAAKSASSRKASQSTNFTWSSIVLKCGRIYPELFAASNPNRDSNRASTSIGQWNDSPPQPEQRLETCLFFELSGTQIVSPEPSWDNNY